MLTPAVLVFFAGGELGVNTHPSPAFSIAKDKGRLQGNSYQDLGTQTAVHLIKERRRQPSTNSTPSLPGIDSGPRRRVWCIASTRMLPKSGEQRSCERPALPPTYLVPQVAGNGGIPQLTASPDLLGDARDIAPGRPRPVNWLRKSPQMGGGMARKPQALPDYFTPEAGPGAGGRGPFLPGAHGHAGNAPDRSAGRGVPLPPGSGPAV